MAGFLDVLPFILQGSQLIGGLLSSREGQQIEQQGFAQQQANERAAANYNKSLLKIQANRESSKLGRDLRRSLSTQRADAARTGLAVGSKSFLALMNDSLTQSEREVVQINNNTKFGQQKLDIETAGKVQSLEIEAKASSQKARSQTSGTVLDLIGVVGTAAKTFGLGGSS